LLLAAGLGTRLRPITDTTPKCLVEISGRPLLDYWLAALGKVGIRDVLINTHHLPQAVRRYVREKNRHGFRIVETFEPILLGSAGTIAASPGWADDADEVLIIYSDNLSDVDISKLLAAHRSHGDPITMLLFRAPNPRACGIAELDAASRVISFEEKPAEPKSNLANAGIYVVTPPAWREIADMNAFDLAFDVLPRFTGRMRGHIHDGFHQDIGDINALDAARQAAPLVFSSRRKRDPRMQQKGKRR
jgi:mannose-1-phosphate guanylyltransferase